MLQFYQNLRSLLFFGPDFNGSAHNIHKAFDNGHAKPGSLYAADGGACLPLKRLENTLQKFRAHAASVVLHTDLIISIPFFLTGKLRNAKGNLTTRLGVFHGIAQKIYQNFLHPKLIAENIQILNLRNICKKFLFFLKGLVPDDHIRLIYNICNAAGSFLQPGLAALNPADLQHLIYNTKKMVAGYLDLGKIILYLRLIISRLDRQIGKPDHRIHRGTDVMGHILEKYLLGNRSLPCPAKGLLQKLLVLLLSFCRCLLCLFPADKIPDHQHQKGCHQSRKQPHMILYHIRERITYRRIQIAVGMVHPIAFSQNADSVVDQLKQGIVSVGNPETELFIICQGDNVQLLVVSQKVADTKGAKKGTVCLPPFNGIDALLNSVIHQNFGIRVIGNGIPVLP